MAVAELNADGTRIVLHTEFREKEIAKSVPGCRWDRDLRTWWVPLSWAACVQLRSIFGATLGVGQNLAAWAQNEVQMRVNPCSELRLAQDSEALQFLGSLYPFQRAGVDFLVRAGHSLIADEMGLGKTVQAIASLEVVGDAAYPAVIVCPNSMKVPWSEAFAKWAPSRTAVILTGGVAARRKQLALVESGEADVAIVNWEQLKLHSRLAHYGSTTLSEAEKTPKELNVIPFRSVLADEAHRGKDPKSKQTRALWALGEGAAVERRIALTGTPIEKSPADLWAIMHFVCPEEYPAKTRFVDRYALSEYDVYGFMKITGVRPETRDELFRILDPRMIRRTKRAVLPQLPEKTYSTRLVELGTKQKKAYDQMRKEMIAELDGGLIMASNTLTKATRLVQFASAYGEIVDGDKLRLSAPSCKVEILEELVEELGDQQAVVFAVSRQLIELAAARMSQLGVRNGQVSGAVGEADRAANIAAFQAGQLQLLFVTLGAGGEGLTLTAAQTAIFLQRAWSNTQNLQAEDRVHRIGQEGRVHIIDVVAQGTIEERVAEVRAEKGERVEEIARDEETFRRWLSK